MAHGHLGFITYRYRLSYHGSWLSRVYHLNVGFKGSELMIT